MKLYEITDKLDRFLSDMPEDKEEARKQFNEILEERTDKIESCVHAYFNAMSDVDALKAQEEKFKARRMQAENQVKWLKEYITSNVKPNEKIKTDTFVIGWRKSESVEYSEDFIPDTLPAEYKNVSVKPNTSEIKKYLKQGHEIDGISLVEKQNIQIK